MFALVLFVILSLNLAHTVVAVTLLVALAVATAFQGDRRANSPGSAASSPASSCCCRAVLGLIFAYHMVGGTPLIASANLTRFDALIDHIRVSHGLSSFTGLFRLNTIVWWPSLEQAKPWENPFVLASTFALAAFGVAGVLNVRFDFSRGNSGASPFSSRCSWRRAFTRRSASITRSS